MEREIEIKAIALRECFRQIGRYASLTDRINSSALSMRSHVKKILRLFFKAYIQSFVFLFYFAQLNYNATRKKLSGSKASDLFYNELI